MFSSKHLQPAPDLHRLLCADRQIVLSKIIHLLSSPQFIAGAIKKSSDAPIGIYSMVEKRLQGANRPGGLDNGEGMDTPYGPAFGS